MSKKPNKNQKDSSKLKSIKDLPKNFKTKAELERHAGDLMVLVDAQNREIQKLTAENENLEQKIKHLEKILENSVPKEGSLADFSLDEVTIARIQLNRLGKVAMTRDLSNEEARRFEIFSKVVQNDAKIDNKTIKSSKVRDVSPVKLLEIAETKIEKK